MNEPEAAVLTAWESALRRGHGESLSVDAVVVNAVVLHDLIHESEAVRRQGVEVGLVPPVVWQQHTKRKTSCR